MFPTLKRVDYIADPDKPVLTPTLQRDLIKERIKKMVTKTKESSATVWAAPILLMIILSYVVYNGQSTSAEIKELKTLVTILQTQKMEQDKTIDKERQEKFQLTREQEAHREMLKDNIRELQFVLRDKLPRRRSDN